MMNLKQELTEKNFFLRKAYETAREYNPSSPLSVSLDPLPFGESIGFDSTKTRRIMLELVGDGFVTSSIGMLMLVVTRSGLEYLRRIEDQPITPLNKLSEPGRNNSPNKVNLDNTSMNQSVKFDLILRELYKYKNDGNYYSIKEICRSLNIPIDSGMELNKIGHRLKNDGLINPLFSHNDCSAELTSHGIDYCEGTSYTYSGHSVITNNYNVSITNSPNANLVNQSSQVTITQNISEANNAIENIRKTIPTDNSIDKSTEADILECLNEIQLSLANNQKPKYSIKSLIDIAGGISSIAAWVTTLGQFAGLINVP
jgi:hypothetical protein